MERVLDVYKRRYDANYPVVCMDESPKQLIQEARPSTKVKPGKEARVDYEYIRCGVAENTCIQQLKNRQHTCFILLLKTTLLQMATNVLELFYSFGFYSATNIF